MVDIVVAPGSEEYNQQMIDKFTGNGEEHVTDPVDPIPLTAIPEGGNAKFYDPKTGEYNWQNHAKELEYRMSGKKTEVTEEDQTNVKNADDGEVQDIVTKAGLNPEDLRNQLDTSGNLSEETYVALEKSGLRRELVELYVSNLNFRRDAQTQEAMTYAGGESEWQSLSQWASQNMPEGDVNRYNELLASSEWRVALDALRVRRDAAGTEPRLISGNNSVAGTTFGYRSKSEMKADMSDPRYAKDPAFRQQVMQKMQSASWDLG
jgi:hypothetical protein